MKLIYNDTELELYETDESYRYRKLMGGAFMDTLTLYFTAPNFLEIPIGSYVMYEGEKFILAKAQDFTKVEAECFDYILTLNNEAFITSCTMVQNTIDRRMKFSLTAKPHEHLKMIVDNLNRRNSGWSIGSCIDGVEKTLSYNFIFAIDALAQLSDLYKTEYDIRNKTVSLGKVEYNKENPLALAYGVGNGFKPNVGRKVPSSNYAPVEILFIQGGEQNIDRSTYGSAELLLPKSQILTYEGREYISDADGYSIRRNDKDIQYNNEDGYDCTDIYPKRVGEVTSVVVVDEEDNFYDIIDTTIPDNLNYEDYIIDGETMTIIFQSGMLAGREFDVKYIHDATDDKAGKRFEIVPQEIDGQTMPNETFCPKPEDTYAVFHCALPDAYICDNDTQSGASWDMFREAAKHLYENEDPKFTFEGELDGLWSKSRWLEIGGKITIGGYVLFTDEDFAQDGVKIRIVGIKDYVKKPYSPELELSNDVVGISVGSELDKIPAAEVDIIEAKKEAIRYAKRGFRDVKETSEMLMDSLLNYSGEINPIVVKTMQLIAGDESLQFVFVDDKETPSRVGHTIAFDPATKQLTSEASIIQHKTLGIKSLSSSHSADEYKYWDIEAYTSPPLADAVKKYYLYIKANKTTEEATMLLSEAAIALEGVGGYYHFLTGVLNTEYNGDRSFVTMFGYTEILPGQMILDLIKSSDFDLATFTGMLIDLVGKKIVVGGDAELLVSKLKIKNTEEEYFVDEEFTDIKGKTNIVSIYKLSEAQPDTPTSTAVPPEGWSLSPLSNIVVNAETATTALIDLKDGELMLCEELASDPQIGGCYNSLTEADEYSIDRDVSSLNILMYKYTKGSGEETATVQITSTDPTMQVGCLSNDWSCEDGVYAPPANMASGSHSYLRLIVKSYSKSTQTNWISTAEKQLGSTTINGTWSSPIAYANEKSDEASQKTIEAFFGDDVPSDYVQQLISGDVDAPFIFDTETRLAYLANAIVNKLAADEAFINRLIVKQLETANGKVVIKEVDGEQVIKVEGEIIATKGKIGLLSIEGSDLVGRDSDGKEIVRISLGAVKSINDLYSNHFIDYTTSCMQSDANVSDVDEYGMATATLDDVSLADLDTDNILRVEQIFTLGGDDVEFELFGGLYQAPYSITTNSGRWSGTPRVVATLYRRYMFGVNPQWQQMERFDSSSQGIVPTTCDISANYEYKIVTQLDLINFSNLLPWTGDIKVFTTPIIAKKMNLANGQTAIAPDGIISYQSNSKYMQYNAGEGFETRFNNAGLRVGSSGVEKLTNGEWVLANI